MAAGKSQQRLSNSGRASMGLRDGRARRERRLDVLLARERNHSLLFVQEEVLLGQSSPKRDPGRGTPHGFSGDLSEWRGSRGVQSGASEKTGGLRLKR